MSRMKHAIALAAGAALFGTAQGGVHKMKLQKIPLIEQLEYGDIATHAKSLALKYAGQNVMHHYPKQRVEEIFKDTSIHDSKAGHPISVSNFLNAQCRLQNL